MAQLGHPRRPLRLRVWNVRVASLLSPKRVSHTHRLGFSYREGYPDIRTVDYWLGGDKAERYPQSRCALDSLAVTFTYRLTPMQDEL